MTAKTRVVTHRAAKASGATLAREIERALKASGTPERARHERRYLRSELEHFGVTVPEIRRLTRAAARRTPDLSRAQLLGVVEHLWGRGVHELRMAAVELLVDAVPQLTATDIKLVEHLIRTSNTWALVDTLAARVVGGLIERFPKLLPKLDRWACDDDFWIRRSALLALLGPLQRGAGDFERFARYADAMLEEKEFFIRKAIGWVLRETSKRRPSLVCEWLLPRASRASGVTLREATRYLTAAQQRRLKRRLE
jgi:3-methyladenine DNA glycosylase AlkD